MAKFDWLTIFNTNFFDNSIRCRRNMIHCFHSLNYHYCVSFFNFFSNFNEFFSSWLRSKVCCANYRTFYNYFRDISFCLNQIFVNSSFFIIIFNI